MIVGISSSLDKGGAIVITISEEEYLILFKIASAVGELPFGESMALPWCRESFPKLDKAMLQFEKMKKEKIDGTSN